MLSIQHAMCLALHDGKPDSKLIAATLYPDAIRAYSGPRQYSHFEKSESGKFSYYMEFPSNMHAGKDFVQKQVAACKEDISLVRPCAIGEETDIDAFYAHNDHLRGEMKQGIDYHLHQDMVFDDFIRREIDCSNKYDDRFVFHGQEMNGKDVRRLISNIEQQGIYVLAHKLYAEKGITANQEWLKNTIKPALDKEYSADLSDKTFSFMNISPEVNQLITDHDWSRLDDGMIPRTEYEKLYNAVEESMSLVDGRVREHELDVEPDKESLDKEESLNEDLDKDSDIRLANDSDMELANGDDMKLAGDSDLELADDDDFELADDDDLEI